MIKPQTFLLINKIRSKGFPQPPQLSITEKNLFGTEEHLVTKCDRNLKFRYRDIQETSFTLELFKDFTSELAEKIHLRE